MEKITFSDMVFPSQADTTSPGLNIGTLLSGLAMNGLLSNSGITNSSGAGLDKKEAAEFSISFAEALIDQINKKYSTDGRDKYRRPLG